MGIIICFSKKKRSRVISVGKTHIQLTLTTVICKALEEKIIQEKGLTNIGAVNLIIV